MLNPKNVRFPITGEELAAMQREHLGRDLDPVEVEMFSEIVQMANEAYEAATKGDVETVQAILCAINSVPVADNLSRHVAALCRGWVLLGCQKGTEELKAAIDGVC